METNIMVRRWSFAGAGAIVLALAGQGSEIAEWATVSLAVLLLLRAVATYPMVLERLPESVGRRTMNDRALRRLELRAGVAPPHTALDFAWLLQLHVDALTAALRTNGCVRPMEPASLIPRDEVAALRVYHERVRNEILLTTDLLKDRKWPPRVGADRAFRGDPLILRPNTADELWQVQELLQRVVVALDLLHRNDSNDQREDGRPLWRPAHPGR